MHDRWVSEIETVQAPAPRWMRSFGRARLGYSDVLVHPDHRRLVAAEDDGSVSIWDLTDGSLRRRCAAFLSHGQADDARGATLRLHPDGVRVFCTVAIVGLEHVTFCWDLDGGNLVETYEYPCVPEYLIDGERAVATGNRGLLVWDLATAKERSRIVRDGWRVLDVIAHQHAAALARTSSALETWDLTSATLRWSLPIDDIASAAALPSGDVLLSRRSGLEVRAARDGALVRSIPCAAAGPLATDRSGMVAVVSSTDLVALDLATGAVRSRFPSRADHTRVDVGHDGRHAVVSDDAARSQVWELATGRCRLRAAARTALVPGSDTALTFEGDVLRQWQLGDEVIATHERAAPSEPTRRCPAGRIAWSVVDSVVQLSRVGDNAHVASLQTRARHPIVRAIEPDARRLAIADALDPAIELWRGEPPLRLHTFRAITVPNAIVFEPSRRWLLSGHADGSIQRWDTSARRHDGSIETGGAAVLELAVSPRGDRFVASFRDAAVRGFGMTDLRELARWDGDDPLRGLAWTDDETIRATTDEGPVVLRWRV